MNNVYISIEGMSALIILILIYANSFELKQPTRKRKLFTRLLIANEIVVVTDMITWLNFGWADKEFLLGTLIMLAYVMPFFVLAIFSRYLYAHISGKADTSKRPFDVMCLYAVVIGVVSLVLCLFGAMFQIKEGTYYPGFCDPYYYLFYIAAMVGFMVIILVNSKRLGLHDTVVVLTFCVVPAVSLLVGLIGVGVKLDIPMMAIEMLLIYTLLQSERENILVHESNTDELTGLLNRRAYEDSLMKHSEVPQEADFVYASIDINGLKQVNDNLGHDAGDELICGAAYCLKRTLGNYGRVYRTGGDEFVAIFFADESHLQMLVEDLQEVTGAWQGKKVDALALSAGFVSKRECESATVKEMAILADERMYKDKAKFYARKGVDRRGQNEAHKVLCSLYTKILKINITEDSFAVINMNPEEQRTEMGYSEHISEWLESFGKRGFVHPEDLEDYLAKTDLTYMRDYFKKEKTSLSVFYRRKVDDCFKQTMMEIIPAGDYTDTHQTLFLYVKNVDN